MLVKCVICGLEIKRKPCDIKNSKSGNYCKKCWGKWRNGKGSWNRGKNNRIIKICKCGKSFLVVQSRIKSAKYCSQKCYHKFKIDIGPKGKHWKLSKETRKKQGDHQKGNKNHQWNGGYFRGKYIGLSQSKKLTATILKRDNYLCTICGNGGRKSKLQAHHLNSVNKFPEQALNINNLITLCQGCHRAFHNKYGYGNNTIEQFNEFIIENIESIKIVQMKKAIIYNLTLEGEGTFYANRILTHNTPPHVIEAKDGKSLKFEWTKIDGKMEGKKNRLKKGYSKAQSTTAFFKKVKHPGNKPNPFVRTMIYTKLRNIIIEELYKAQSK